jgi:hypothetical protein
MRGDGTPDATGYRNCGIGELPAAGQGESRIQRLTEGSPLLTKILDDLASLRMTDLDQLVAEVTTLPFDNQRREVPAEVLPKALIGEAVTVEFQPPQQPSWPVDGHLTVNYGIVSDLV